MSHTYIRYLFPHPHPFGQIWEHSRAEFKGHKEAIFQGGRFNYKNLKHEIT